MIKNKTYFFVLICLLIIGFVLLTLPMEGFSHSIHALFNNYDGLDKAAHFTLFASLTFFIQLSINMKRRTLLLLVFCVAGCAELMQTFSVRSVNAFDLAANISGVLVMFLLFSKYKKVTE